MTERVWEFDIGVSTNDLLKEGVLVHHYRRVEVAAEDYTSAQLIACQMAMIDGATATEALYLG